MGATMHCAHGSWASLLRYIDWRPGRYYTAVRTPKGGMMGAPPMTETVEFTRLADDRTEIEYRAKCRGTMARLKMQLFAPIVRRSFAGNLRRLEDLLREREREAVSSEAVSAAATARTG